MITPAVHDPELVRMLDGIFARVRSGETLALATVEVHANGVVTMQAEGPGYYNELHSAVHRLAVKIAMQDDPPDVD